MQPDLFAPAFEIFSNHSTLIAVLIAVWLLRQILSQWTIRWQSTVRGKLERNGAVPAGTLLVISPAMGGAHSLKDAVFVAAEALDGADKLLLRYGAPIFPELNWLMNADPARIAANMDSCIAKAVEEGGYKKVVLFGYSAGALLIRKAFVFNFPGFGADNPKQSKPKPPSAPKPKTVEEALSTEAPAVETKGAPNHYIPWHERVERLILLAGINGGWTREDRRVLGIVPAAAAISLFEFLGLAGFLRSLERGHPFVENLRIDWLRLSDLGQSPKLVVQLVGVKDEIVDADSEMDLSATNDFHYLTLPSVGHSTIAHIGLPAPDHPLTYRRNETAKLLAASLCFAFEAKPQGQAGNLATTKPGLYEPSALAWVSGSIGRVAKQGRDASVRRVVIVLHGIRDNAHWAEKFRLVIEGALGEQALAVVAPSFGRFPLTDFMLGRRDKPVRWFARTYSELLAKHPKIDSISVIGHSYGTWVVAKALERYVSLRLDKVFLAGSVLPRSYKWTPFVTNKQLSEIGSAPADGDWVVGIFPASYDVLRKMIHPLTLISKPLANFLSLGDAGVKGFDDPVAKQNEVGFFTGGHGAFKDHLSYLKIAGIFAVEGGRSDRFNSERTQVVPVAAKRNWIVRSVNAVSLPLLILGLGALFSAVVLGGRLANDLPSETLPFIFSAALAWLAYSFLRWL